MNNPPLLPTLEGRGIGGHEVMIVQPSTRNCSVHFDDSFRSHML